MAKQIAARPATAATDHRKFRFPRRDGKRGHDDRRLCRQHAEEKLPAALVMAFRRDIGLAHLKLQQAGDVLIQLRLRVVAQRIETHLRRHRILPGILVAARSQLFQFLQLPVRRREGRIECLHVRLGCLQTLSREICR
jgi:hypothetical protein